MNRLKLLRKRENITLRELAKYSDISNAVISQIETGKRPFRQIHIDKLVAFLTLQPTFCLVAVIMVISLCPNMAMAKLCLLKVNMNALLIILRHQYLIGTSPRKRYDQTIRL